MVLCFFVVFDVFLGIRLFSSFYFLLPYFHYSVSFCVSFNNLHSLFSRESWQHYQINNVTAGSGDLGDTLFELHWEYAYLLLQCNTGPSLFLGMSLLLHKQWQRQCLLLLALLVTSEKFWLQIPFSCTSVGVFIVVSGCLSIHGVFRPCQRRFRLANCFLFLCNDGGYVQKSILPP